MNYISTSSCDLYKQSIDCFVGGYREITTKVLITANLQQYKGGRWVNIKTFTKNSNSFSTSLNETVNISKGYTYRVSAEIKAWNRSKIETRNLISKQNKY